MDRRTLLKLAAGLPAALGLPSRAMAAPERPAPPVLVLLELNGGNDGLNTVAPWRDARYRSLRPTLALGADAVLPLDEGLAMHRALEPLLPWWRRGELAWVTGVGCRPPNRSHFRAIAIWDHASTADPPPEHGWLAPWLARLRRPGSHADAVVLGRNPAPVTGSGARVAVMKDIDTFLRQARRLDAVRAGTPNPALAHILAVEARTRAWARELEAAISPQLPGGFAPGSIGHALEDAARLIASGAAPPVIKVAQGGYDTHARQAAVHRRRLAELAAALAAFATALEASGDWQRVLVMSYSEFGRRARENASAGTDHGAAAPHFFLGGRVRGGLYGTRPDLARLEDGDLVPGTDFRRLYSTVLEGWFGLGSAARIPGHAPLPVLRA